jgi:chorismate mutase
VSDTDTDTTSRDLQQRLDAAEAALAEARAERARLWEEVARLRAERREVEYYEARATQMQTSVSWQVTAPLRAAKALWAQVQRKLEQRRER